MKRNLYSNEFKLESVKLAQSGNVSIAQAARDLGVNDELLRRWIRQFGTKPDEKKTITPDEHSELIRLRRENRILKEERDILKKAMGICTRELP